MRGGSSPVVVSSDGGEFVAKLRGAGHGVSALIAEIIVAELADRLGLPVPERVAIELSCDFLSEDRNDELADLLSRSVGLNLGFRNLEGARDLTMADIPRVDRDFRLRVLWLDGFSMNPDRSRTNPNILMWNESPWLIDHGSALPFQHYWAHLEERAPEGPMSYAGHIFEDDVAGLASVDSELAALFSREVLAAATARIPDAFLEEVGPETSVARSRAVYEAFLWKRLKAPRPFIAR
jgi:hypothetical protein